MAGHYPPVCYPANGWSLRPEDAARDVDLDDEKQVISSLRIDGVVTFSTRCYRFSRLGDAMT